MKLTVRPCSLRHAAKVISEWHRHNVPPRGWLFGCQLIDEQGVVRGVGVMGRPVARCLQDGTTCEVTRLCTDGTRNACSMLYAALCRAAKALGYKRVVTYTLASEPGSSLLAAGFRLDAELRPRPTWDTPSRRREQTDADGRDKRPPDAKVRWEIEF